MQKTSENEYLEVLKNILETGIWSSNRTAFRTIKTFGQQMHFDLSEGFPLLTTKKIPWRNIVTELLWFLKGDKNISYLVERGNPIWTDWPCRRWLKETGQEIPNQRENPEAWKQVVRDFTLKMRDLAFAEKWGDCGPIYGHQWRHWPDGKGGEIDQISRLIKGLKENPSGRRHIVSAWNVANIEEMDIAGLPPCHCLFQFDVTDGKLSCQLYQRSCDFFLGVPFNIASYSLLTLMVAQVTGLSLGKFVWSGGDVHLYENCVDQAKEQLTREPRTLPKVILNKEVDDIFCFRERDIELVGYDPHPPLRANVAV